MMTRFFGDFVFDGETSNGVCDPSLLSCDRIDQYWRKLPGPAIPPVLIRFGGDRQVRQPFGAIDVIIWRIHSGSAGAPVVPDGRLFARWSYLEIYLTISGEFVRF